MIVAFQLSTRAFGIGLIVAGLIGFGVLAAAGRVKYGRADPKNWGDPPHVRGFDLLARMVRYLWRRS